MANSLFYRGTLLFDRFAAHLPTVGCFRPLKGRFSAWEELNSGSLEGQVISPDQKPGCCPANSMTKLAGMRQHDRQPWPVFWVRTDDASLVGGPLHWRDRDDRLCAEGVFHTQLRRHLTEDRYFAQILLPKAKILPGAWTSITSNWGQGGNYFHWMLDCLTRLALLEYLPEEPRILLPAKRARFVDETMELLGLQNISRVAPGFHLKPERYYFCAPSAMTGAWNPIGCDWLRNQFSSYRKPSPDGPPVLLTRRGCSRVPSNIDEIENAFSQKGFRTIDCGKLTVREQIRILSDAPAIAGLHGAAMTNILWAHPGTPVLELFNPGYRNACYEQIAYQGKLNYSFQVLGESGTIKSINGWLAEID